MKFPEVKDIKAWYQSGDWTLAMVQDALQLEVITQSEFEDIVAPKPEYPPTIDDIVRGD